MENTMHRIIRCAALSGAAILMTACGAGEKPGVEIATPQGPVQGVTTENGLQNIMGIPFAAPPTGDLRWRPPAPAPGWNDTRQANEFAPMCMQDTSVASGFMDLLIRGQGLGWFKTWLIKKAVASAIDGEVSEDCLYLNIRTPNIAPDGTVSGEALPVMVWIHGGGHQFGSSSSSMYQSDALAEKGVVLVTIAYRLGAFGYMAHPALSGDDPRGVSGNYGTLDQIAALEWVRDNISAYGGDPDNVTIFGESAGSWSVIELMSSPLAQGLFHKAIGQSGASTYHLGQMDKDGAGWPSGYEVGIQMADALGLEDPSAEDLRAVPADRIVRATTEKMTDAFHHIRDGVVFPKNVGIAVQDGSFQSVPLMIGYNSDEATVFFPNDPEPSVWIEGFPTQDREKQLAALAPHYGEASEPLIDLYGLDDPDTYETGGTQMMGDEFFGSNIRFVARHNEAAGAPTYNYVFTRIPPSRKQFAGAYHAAELVFVFGTEEPIMGWTDADNVLSDQIRTYWTNFARTGDPNGTGLPAWPSYQGENWMRLAANDDLKTEAIKDYRQDKLDALEAGLLKKLDLIRPLQTPPAPVGGDSQSAE